MQEKAWCSCAPETLPAPAALAWEDHGDSCGWPEASCLDTEHGARTYDGEGCGLAFGMLFCRCVGEKAWTLDAERGWWVRTECGWPTELAYRGMLPAADDLVGVKPKTWRLHRKRGVTPKARYARLTAEQKERHAAWDKRAVRTEVAVTHLSTATQRKRADMEMSRWKCWTCDEEFAGDAGCCEEHQSAA